MTITLVAAEALAVPTAMPIVARDLGGVELYGLVFSAFSVGALLGIVVVGALIDLEGVVRPFVAGLVLMNLAWSPGQLVGSAFAGAVAQATSDAVPFLITAGLCLAALVPLRKR